MSKEQLPIDILHANGIPCSSLKKYTFGTAIDFPSAGDAGIFEALLKDVSRNFRQDIKGKYLATNALPGEDPDPCRVVIGVMPNELARIIGGITELKDTLLHQVAGWQKQDPEVSNYWGKDTSLKIIISHAEKLVRRVASKKMGSGRPIGPRTTLGETISDHIRNRNRESLLPYVATRISPDSSPLSSPPRSASTSPKQDSGSESGSPPRRG